MIVLSIAFSEACNLDCSYCNVDKLSKKSINTDLFFESYEKVRSKNPQELIQVDFYGGEPLLHWDKIVTVTKELKDDPNVQFYMPTNGLLLDDEKVEFLNANKVRVSLSYDGLWQDINRNQHDGRGTNYLYQKKLPIIKKLNDLSCHSMIYSGNNNILENHLYIKKVLNLNPDLTLIRDVGVWTNESAQEVNYGFSELVDWYIENVDNVEMPKIILTYLRHILRYTAKDVRIDYCGAGDTHLSFSEDKLIACNRFKDDDLYLKIPEYKNMAACESCSVKNYCRKGCLYENIKNEGPIESICFMYKHFYKEVQRMIKTLKGNEYFKRILKREIYES
ncbi:radical SAM protein [Halobacteriovorax vibrionivorans]|uniref:Radical SAM protein n=1 Tax=Halobacteriovorax vibrionivorans TaxID=2152716 RepID=A0ABY0IIQ9_9BACT|nr:MULTISPECIES: radical SAM protein [Halobacteriovorax]RZF22832.1 radical SAM protein [Halobacteriovorax vibrionivorans]TGD47375.1 radical SAM protein [Halobacteriovorax sp. Y22]